MYKDAPTEKQMAVIRRLAKQTNTAVDYGSIGSKKRASEVIDKLIGKRKSDSGKGNDCREKKIAYGLAVKLIFQKSIQLNLDYKADQFWTRLGRLLPKMDKMG